MGVSQQTVPAGWIDDLLKGRASLPYRELTQWNKSPEVRDRLSAKAKESVEAEIDRLLTLPQFDVALVDAKTREAVVEAILNAFTFSQNELQEAVGKSFDQVRTTWSDNPIDLRGLEADSIDLAKQVFERATGLGFSGTTLEPGVIATVLNMSEVKVLADVVRLEESLGMNAIGVDDLALIMARYNALRKDYVVTRKMISGGSFHDLSTTTEEPLESVMPAAPAQAPAPAARPAPAQTPPPMTAKPPEPAKIDEDDAFGLGVSTPTRPVPPPPPPPRPAPVATPAVKPPAMTPPPAMAPKPAAPVPEPPKPAPVAATPPQAPTAPAAPAAPKVGAVFEPKGTWKETFLDQTNRKALMMALRTRNEAEYDNWVNKVAQLTSWKSARVHIDNYLFIFGIERGTFLWDKVMKSSRQFFIDD